jgi:transposase
MCAQAYALQDDAADQIDGCSQADNPRDTRRANGDPQSADATPAVGLLTAMVAATSGEVSHFRGARHFASWFGLTPKEHSSGATRHLGRISKRGDRYLRMLTNLTAPPSCAKKSRARHSRWRPDHRYPYPLTPSFA